MVQQLNLKKLENFDQENNPRSGFVLEGRSDDEEFDDEPVLQIDSLKRRSKSMSSKS